MSCSPSIRSFQEEFSVKRLSAIRKAMRCDSVRGLSLIVGTISHLARSQESPMTGDDLLLVIDQEGHVESKRVDL